MCVDRINSAGTTRAVQGTAEVEIRMYDDVLRMLLDELQSALAPLLLQRLKHHLGDDWWSKGGARVLDKGHRRYPPAPGDEERWFLRRDALFAINLILTAEVWDTLFREFGRTRIRPHLQELRASRNLFEHDRKEYPLTRDELARAIDTTARLLSDFHLPDASARVRELTKKLETNIGNVFPALINDRLQLLDLQGDRGAAPRDPVATLSVDKLMEHLRKGLIEPQRQLIRVCGTFAPRLLLSKGWWTRNLGPGGDGSGGAWREGDGLQKWLFRGFEQWGPSWDLRVASAGRPEGKPQPLVGQLASGDEANSVCVVLAGDHAGKATRAGESWGGFEAEVTGYLTQRTLQLAELHRSGSAPILDTRSEECCIVVDGRDGCAIEMRSDPTSSYTGYLWQCVAPRRWLPQDGDLGALRLDQVLFIWEHIEFTASDAVAYGLDILKHKHAYLTRKYGDLVLLQKSDSMIEGRPAYPIEQFGDALKDYF